MRRLKPHIKPIAAVWAAFYPTLVREKLGLYSRTIIPNIATSGAPKEQKLGLLTCRQ